MTDIKKLRELAIDAMLDVEKDQDESDRFQFIKAANPQAIIEILDRLERYEKALMFYADIKSWRVTREDELHQAIMTIIGDVDSYSYQHDEWSPNILQIIAGKAAREALEGGKP